MLYLISIVLFTLGLGSALCWIFFVINKENQALNASIDKIHAEVDSLFNAKKVPIYNVGDKVRDGGNTRTYMGANVWQTTLLHEIEEYQNNNINKEGEQNLAFGISFSSLQAIDPINGTFIGNFNLKSDESEEIERWRKVGECVDKPEPEDKPS